MEKIFVYLQQMRQGRIPGFEEYTITIGENDIILQNRLDKPMKNSVSRGSVYWGLMKNGEQTRKLAEDWIELTFPGIKKDEYIIQLYKDVENVEAQRVRKVRISPGIILSLYSKKSYLLETPLELNLEDDIKKIFPGQMRKMINTEEGNKLRRWRELWFVTKENITCVEWRLRKLLQNTTFSN